MHRPCLLAIVSLCGSASVCVGQTRGDAPKIDFVREKAAAFPVVERTKDGELLVRGKGRVEMPQGWQLQSDRIVLRVICQKSGRTYTEGGKADRVTGLAKWGPIKVGGISATKQVRIAARATFRDPDGNTRVFESETVTRDVPDPKDK